MLLHETIHLRACSGTKMTELVHIWGITEVLGPYTMSVSVLSIYHCLNKSCKHFTILVIASKNTQCISYTNRILSILDKPSANINGIYDGKAYIVFKEFLKTSSLCIN
jgi:hypothetical protein